MRPAGPVSVEVITLQRLALLAESGVLPVVRRAAERVRAAERRVRVRAARTRAAPQRRAAGHARPGDDRTTPHLMGTIPLGMGVIRCVTTSQNSVSLLSSQAEEKRSERDDSRFSLLPLYDVTAANKYLGLGSLSARSISCTAAL